MAIPLITVCICTFKRQAFLENLLRKLESQRTDNLFEYDVVVADNDAGRSAEPVVRALAGSSSLKITYCAEPVANIALARNAALANARGNFIAFIDDDEFPTAEWLYQLFHARDAHRVDGVLGPVLPHFMQEPHSWLEKGKFFDRTR